MQRMALDELARLQAMLRCRGAALPRAPDADALAALERCRKCHQVKLCDEFLAAPASNGARMFCPNTHYVEARRQRRLAFTP
jgi:hypothetical protein